MRITVYLRSKKNTFITNETEIEQTSAKKNIRISSG